MKPHIELVPALPASGRDGDRAAELDRGTLARAQRGDPDACRALVERHQHAVFVTVARVLGARGTQALVADLAQETFLRVFRHLGTFAGDGPGRLSSWVLTIAVRVTLDELKRRRADRPSGEVVDVNELPDPVSVEDAACARNLHERLDQALARLGPGLRAVLLLRVVHELPYEEIAARLGLELGTVKSRLARARAALWQALADAGDQP